MFRVRNSVASKVREIVIYIALIGLLGLEVKTAYDLQSISKEVEFELEKDGTLNVSLCKDEYYPQFHEEYSELYSTYDEYVKTIAYAIEKTNYPGDLVTQYSFYLVMLKRGYLSVGDEFKYGYNTLEVHDNLGFNIVSGKSVCRNQASNLTDVLVALGYDARTIGGCLYTEKGLDEYNENHAITYVRHKGYDYFLDPTNETIFLKKAPNALCSINSEGNRYTIIEIDLDKINKSNPDKAPIVLEEHDDYLADREHMNEKFELSNGIANLYDEYLQIYEQDNLVEYEEKINNILNELDEKYSRKMGVAKPLIKLELKYDF